MIAPRRSSSCLPYLLLALLAGCGGGGGSSSSGPPAGGAPALGFASDDQLVPEAGGSFEVVLVLSAAADVDVAFELAVAGTAIEGEDFLLPERSGVLPAGELTAAIEIELLDDDLDEAEETIELSLASADGAGVGTPAATTIRIEDDDPTPAIAFAAAGSSVAEGAGSAAVPVALSAPSGQVVELPFELLGAPPADVVEIGPPLVLAPGATGAAIEIEVLRELDVFEPDVVVELGLGTPVHALPGAPATHRLTVENDHLFEEHEPNDQAQSANDLGSPLAPGRFGTLRGHIHPFDQPDDPFDAFGIVALEDTRMDLVLSAASPTADLGLWVGLPDSQMLDLTTFDQQGPGQEESGSFVLMAGQPYVLLILSHSGASAWELAVSGADPTAPLAGGPPPARDPRFALPGGQRPPRDPLLMSATLDWPTIARALGERRRAPAALPYFEVAGRIHLLGAGGAPVELLRAR